MTIDVAPIGSIDPAPRPDAPKRSQRPRADAAELSSAIPERPPAEVLDAIGIAAERHGELLAQGRELRFEAGEHGVTVEVRDADGALLRTLAPSEALDVATGAPLD